MRLLFVADVHAANTIVRKAVAAAARYEVDHLLLAGDLCGKTLRPVVELSSGGYRVGDGENVLQTETEVEVEIRRIEDRGDYVLRCDEGGLEELRTEPRAVEAAFDRAIRERLISWKTYIEENLAPSTQRVLVTPGNDDPHAVDEVLGSLQDDRFACPTEEIYRVGGNEIVTLDYTNPTPWSTPREKSERDLRSLIARRTAGLDNPGTAIFNFHCPPHGTQLDLAPELNADFEFVVDAAGQSFVHVGSTAVREAILESQPLLALHGHVHEAAGEERLGSTLCLNPGSEYGVGNLRAFLVETDAAGQLVKYQRVEG